VAGECSDNITTCEVPQIYEGCLYNDDETELSSLSIGKLMGKKWAFYNSSMNK